MARRMLTKMRTNLVMLLIFVLSFVAASSAATGPHLAPAQEPDDKIEGRLIIDRHATITGSVGGVVFRPIAPNAFAVTFSFGELSPLNQNLVVRIAVTVTVQTSQQYQIRLTMTPPTITDPNAVQLSDVGIGIQNLRLIGLGSCAGAIQPPFNNDPATAMTINPTTGRATYPTTLQTVASTSPIVIRGPALPLGQAAFDLIMAAAPQFYSPGNVNFTFTLQLQRGPAFSCP